MINDHRRKRWQFWSATSIDITTRTFGRPYVWIDVDGSPVISHTSLISDGVSHGLWKSTCCQLNFQKAPYPIRLPRTFECIWDTYTAFRISCRVSLTYRYFWESIALVCSVVTWRCVCKVVGRLWACDNVCKQDRLHPIRRNRINT